MTDLLQNLANLVATTFAKVTFVLSVFQFLRGNRLRQFLELHCFQVSKDIGFQLQCQLFSNTLSLSFNYKPALQLNGFDF